MTSIEDTLTGEVLDWMDAKRVEIARIAEAEVGPQLKGSDEVLGYWRDVLPREWGDASVRQYAKTKEWCGGFALWCLHQAGIAKEQSWIDGLGFLGPAGLKTTVQPKPGDIAYTHSPFNHHSVVYSYVDGTLVTIDGNQPDCRKKIRPLPRGIVFYSIEPMLLRALEPADYDPTKVA